MKRIIFLFLVAIKIFTCCLLAVEKGEGTEKYTAEEFGVESILEALPDEVREELPQGEIFSENTFTEKFSFEYFWGFLMKTFKNAISPSVKSLTATLGLVLLSAVLSAFKGLTRSDSLTAVFELASSLCILLTLYKTALSLVERVGAFLSNLTAVITVMVPAMLAVGTAGGNGGASAASSNAMMLGVALIEGLAVAGLFPILKLCFGMAVCSGIGSGLHLEGISGLLRNIFTWVIGLLAAAISAMMTFQTSIAAKADSLGVRAVKFAASSALPVAGGIASDAVSAVAGSISLIKETVGWGGVIIIVIMTLPVIIDILMIRLGVSASSVAADIMGLQREKRMLDEMCGLFGFLVAICVICSLMFVYSLALFAKSSTALMG